MDIKTRLEDDKVLGVSLETKSFLNSKGVYTIEDFLNIKESDIPVTRSNYYLGMQHIFRHAYLDQELVYDVLLEKEYEINKKGLDEFSEDYLKLGLADKLRGKRNIARDMEEWIQNNKEFLTSDKISMKVIIEGLVDRSNIHKEFYELQHDRSDKISLDEYKTKRDELEKKASKYPKIYLNHSNILKYYKDYIDAKKEIKEEDKNDTYTLMYLKEQISQLVNQRDNLDRQIEVLQSRVNEILGESKTYGK